jgi:ribosomal protein L6P/L9E
MSRIGKKPIPIPDKVKVSVRDGAIDVQRWERYRELYNEMQERWKNRYD